MAAPSAYEFFILNAVGKCLFYEDFKGSNTLEKIMSERGEQDRLKNIFGISIAIKSFSKGMSPRPINNFKSFATNKYKYNIFESATGLRFVMFTSVDDTDHSDVLRHIYGNIFLEYVNRNPLYEKDSLITFPVFREKLREAIKTYLS